jgi:Long-chain acyl-CoA synthetases (AMP-forming)
MSDFTQQLSTLSCLYSKSNSEYADKKAYSSTKGSTLSFKEFDERVKEIIEKFNVAGLQKGEKIAILGGNMANWAAAYFATVISGRVVVPVLIDFTAFEIVNILEHSDTKALIVSTKLLYKIPEHILNKLRLVVRMDNLETIKIAEEAKYQNSSDPTPEDIASIIYTSGTSGTSKGVLLTHSNICAQIKMITNLFPVYPKDTFLSILPLSHAYECSIGMIYPFSRGSSVTYLDGAPTPSLLMPALKEVRPTIMLSVPLIVEKIYKTKIRALFTRTFMMRLLYSISFIRRIFHKAAGKKLLETFGGNLRFFGIGGSRLDGVVERFLSDAGFPYAIGYGLTETSPLLAGAIPGKVKWQSTGPVLNGVEIKIDNPNSENIGEIVVKGPNIMAGYYKDDEGTKKSFTPDGWFKTKDLGLLDKRGNLYIKGRKDNMIIGPNGENIYPEDIETIINEYDLVLESLVIRTKNNLLVAKVHFNYEEIQSSEDTILGPELTIEEKLVKIKKDLITFINDRVNKASKIAEIIEQPIPFEKTATQKIKRFLYSESI